MSFFQGTIGFEAQIDKCLELSEYLYNKIKDREGYEMVFDGKVRHRHWQKKKKEQKCTKSIWMGPARPGRVAGLALLQLCAGMNSVFLPLAVNIMCRYYPPMNGATGCNCS